MRTIWRAPRVICALALLAFFPATATSQSATQLTVTVADPSGARIADAAVVLSRDTEQRAEVTDRDGVVIVRGLAVGAWTLDVTRDGFTSIRRPVVVQNTPVSILVSLEVGALRQNVIVEAARPEDALQLDASAAGGTRLDIPVRELPASLTVITQDLMQERGINNAMEAAELSPGITTFMDSGSIPGFQVRGFSSSAGSVSVTRDGIRQNTVPQSGRPLDTFLLDRIEVLKGPASLMSGEGAIGASMNYVTKQPRRELEIDSLLSVGSFDKYRVGLGVSVPVTSQLAARADYSHTDGGGYVDRTGEKMKSAAASLRWTPVPAATIRASAVYTGDHIRSYYGTPLVNGVVDERTRYTNYNMRDNRNVAMNNYGRLDGDVVLGGWTMHGGFFAATQDVQWRNYESTQYVPASGLVQVGSYFLAAREDLLLGSQLDTRRSFTIGGRSISVVAGYSYQNQDQKRWTGGTIPSQNRLVSLIDPEPIFDPGFPFVFDRTVKVFTHTLFGEASVEVHPKVKVISGLRWEQFQVDRNQVTTGFASQEYHPTTGRIGAVYLPTDLITLYVSHSRAVEPQTPLVSISPANMGFSLLPSRQWEFGTKSTFFNGKLDATVAVFQIDKENIVTSTIVDNERITQQIGQQRSRGVELSGSYRPYPSLQVMSDVTLLDPEYVEFNENLGTGIVSRAGNAVPGSSDVVWNLTPMQQVGPVTISTTIRRVGWRWRDTANTLRQEPYTVSQLSLSSKFYRGTRVTLTVRNLTDELYIPRNNSANTGRIAAPRNFEIQFSRIFNPR
jgi:iron complex outermembrane receptor protein